MHVPPLPQLTTGLADQLIVAAVSSGLALRTNRQISGLNDPLRDRS